MGTGATVTTTYKLSEENSNSIYKSDYFLKQYNIGNPVQNLGRVAVIGGGNVAIDSARVAKRTGAKEVYILYRRNQELMPACKSELIEALDDGVKIEYLTRVISAEIENHKINSFRVSKDGKQILCNELFSKSMDSIITTTVKIVIEDTTSKEKIEMGEIGMINKVNYVLEHVSDQYIIYIKQGKY